MKRRKLDEDDGILFDDPEDLEEEEEEELEDSEETHYNDERAEWTDEEFRKIIRDIKDVLDE